MSCPRRISLIRDPYNEPLLGITLPDGRLLVKQKPQTYMVAPSCETNALSNMNNLLNYFTKLIIPSIVLHQPGHATANSSQMKSLDSRAKSARSAIGEPTVPSIRRQTLRITQPSPLSCLMHHTLTQPLGNPHVSRSGGTGRFGGRPPAPSSGRAPEASSYHYCLKEDLSHNVKG